MIATYLAITAKVIHKAHQCSVRLDSSMPIVFIVRQFMLPFMESEDMFDAIANLSVASFQSSLPSLVFDALIFVACVVLSRSIDELCIYNFAFFEN